MPQLRLEASMKGYEQVGERQVARGRYGHNTGRQNVEEGFCSIAVRDPQPCPAANKTEKQLIRLIYLLSLKKCDIKSGTVEVDELEKKHLQGQTVFVLRIRPWCFCNGECSEVVILDYHQNHIHDRDMCNSIIIKDKHKTTYLYVQ